MFNDRAGLIIWVSDLKNVKHFERYGNIHYVSKKMFYVVLYTDASQAEQTMKQLQKMPYVKKIEKSHRHEIRTEYSTNIPDKTQIYTS